MYYTNMHVHPYYLPTTVNDGHLHYMRAYTMAAPGGLDNHVHRYFGSTTYNDGHTHNYNGVSGPALPLPGGDHYHFLQGETTFNDGHKHFYRDRTGGSIRV